MSSFSFVIGLGAHPGGRLGFVSSCIRPGGTFRDGVLIPRPRPFVYARGITRRHRRCLVVDVPKSARICSRCVVLRVARDEKKAPGLVGTALVVVVAVQPSGSQKKEKEKKEALF